jgi:hypothetical protein
VEESTANHPNRISFSNADAISDAEKLILALQKQWIDEKTGKGEGKSEIEVVSRKPRSYTGDFGGRIGNSNPEAPIFTKKTSNLANSNSSESLKETGSLPRAEEKGLFPNKKASAPLVTEDKSNPGKFNLNHHFLL